MRRAVWAAALLTAGCAPAASLKPQLKDIRPMPRFFLQELVVRRKAAGLALKVYDTGALRVPGETLSELKSPLAQVKLALPAFLLRHPERGLILFDAGLPPAPVGRGKEKGSEFGVPFDYRQGNDLVSQLRREGVALDDVRTVVLSHLHWDHVGSVESFQKATVIVDRREWEAQKEKTLLGAAPDELDPAAMEPRLRLRLIDLSSAPPYGVFDHGLDLFDDASVYLLDLRGHSPGGLGLWANLDSGPVLLTGDASWILDNHQDLALPLRETMADPPQYWRKLNMIKRMQETVPQMVVFPGHDLAPLKLQPKPDITLGP